MYPIVGMLFLLGSTNAHIAAWHKGMYCFNVRYSLYSILNRKLTFSMSDRATNLVWLIRTRMMRLLLCTSFPSSYGGVSHLLSFLTSGPPFKPPFFTPFLVHAVNGVSSSFFQATGNRIGY